MARDQKTKSKASQAQKKASPNQRVAPATATQTQVPDTTYITADTTGAVPDEMQVANTIATTDTASASEVATSIQQERTAVQQSVPSDQKVVWAGLQPNWPTWPISKPGPRSTPPPPGMRPINKLRPEQMEEVGYNQQTGEPATQNPLRSLPDERTTGPTSFDLPTAQEVVGKRKRRL